MPIKSLPVPPLYEHPGYRRLMLNLSFSKLSIVLTHFFIHFGLSDIGVTRHIGEALGDEVHIHGSNIVALGIAPWGYVQHRETLVGLDVCFL